MKLDIYTKGRKRGYDAKGVYDENGVVIKKGSIISKDLADKVNPIVKRMREDNTIVSNEKEVLVDVRFDSLSTAATFVTGRIANGMIVWKTDDGKYVKYALEQGSGECKINCAFS